MAYKDTGQQVEFINAVGGELTVFAAGTVDEVVEALEAGRLIDQAVDHPPREVVSPGTHYAIGKLSANLGPEAAQALADYESTIQADIEEQRRKIRGEA